MDRLERFFLEDAVVRTDYTTLSDSAYKTFFTKQEAKALLNDMGDLLLVKDKEDRSIIHKNIHTEETDEVTIVFEDPYDAYTLIPKGIVTEMEGWVHPFSHKTVQELVELYPEAHIIESVSEHINPVVIWERPINSILESLSELQKQELQEKI